MFECWLRPQDLESLRKRLFPLVNPKDWDSIRFYSLCIDDVLRTEILGRGQVTSDPDFYMQ